MNADAELASFSRWFYNKMGFNADLGIPQNAARLEGWLGRAELDQQHLDAVDYTSEEIDEALQLLRGYSSAIPSECIDQMELVLRSPLSMEPPQPAIKESALTAAQLADALGCFGNAAISAMHSGTHDVAAITQGVEAVMFRLHEIAKENHNGH